MNIFSVLSMIGGLALFLYGMNVLGDGLAKLAGGRLERVLEKLTKKRYMAVLLGAGVTAVIQSSSATTVMVVGFVNSGIMKLGQVVGIIMGANIGTTVTSWILSLSGISSGNVFVQLLKPSSFSPVLAAIGIILIMTGKTEKRKDIGNILVGFAILMTGMDTMSAAVEPLAENPQFASILTMFSNPILGLLAGTVLTAAIQSSSASVGILQALCATGSIQFSTALPIIMGQNIGTCVTALMSSVGANKNAKRASMIHLYFNLIGTILFMILFYGLNSVIHFSFFHTSANAAGIAVLHSLFNIFAVIVLYPASNLLVKLATWTIPDGKEENAVKEEIGLDERFLTRPAFALELCRNTTVKMLRKTQEQLHTAFGLLEHYDDNVLAKVGEMETEVDSYEDALGTYMVQLGSKNLSEDDSKTLTILLHCISDFERMSDHALNIAQSFGEAHRKKLQFSPDAMEELRVYMDAVEKIVDDVAVCFQNNDLQLAREVEPLEQVINKLNKKIKERHVKRLRKGKCTIEMGFILQDISTNLERMADHCSNIAICLIEVDGNEFDPHTYVEEIRRDIPDWFEKEYKELKHQYALPAKK